MSKIEPKIFRLRLHPDSYRQLQVQVLRRDTWRCQYCGAMSNLQVRHQRFRSHSGDDSEQNLITLCQHWHLQVQARLGGEKNRLAADREL